MKIRRMEIRNFRRFRNYSLDFIDPATGLARDLVVLSGQNGAGKSSILQAIAACLGTATGRLDSPTQLHWPGFDLSLAGQFWGGEPEVDIELEFSPDELTATRDLFNQLPEAHRLENNMTPPGDTPVITLNMRGSRVRGPSSREYFQCRGRTYAMQLVRLTGKDVFQRVGFAFWYTEHRTTHSLTPVDSDGRVQVTDDSLLRQRLLAWQTFHDRVKHGGYQLRPGQRDYYALIEEAYQQVFPKRSLLGVVPRGGLGDMLAEPYFMLSDGKREYELSEMSAGERAVFPILFDFVNWSIHRSVVLVDELELHLHPPMQQALIRAIRKLGSENQIILTTHSEALATIVPPKAIFRVDRLED